MKHASVSSSFIRSIGYDKETQTLVVNFHKGDPAIYPGTPESTVRDFLNASSKGRFYLRYIKIT